MKIMCIFRLAQQIKAVSGFGFAPEK